MPERVRTRLSKQERQDQIVRATISVVAHHGFGQASITAIAAEAGMAKGLVWHYFDDAADVMRTTALRTAARLRDEIADELDLSATVPEVVRSAVSAAAALTRTHADELRAVTAIVEGLRDADGRRLVGDDGHDETYALERQLFGRGQDQGSVRDVDLQVLAVTYQASIDAMIAHLLDHPDADPQAYATALTDLLLTGLAH